MNHYTAAYNSPVGPIVIESDGEALTGLRFGEGKLGLRSGDSNIGTAPYLMPTQATSSLTIFDEAIRKGTAFQQRVWQALLTIPYGKTVSYGELARMVGCKSAQAVGQAVGANPIALLIPCHRVVGANGTLGGYAYGLNRKKQLLELEK